MYHTQVDHVGPRATPTKEAIATQKWENEGGATGGIAARRRVEAVAVAAAPRAAYSPGERAAIDDLQDEEMARTSSDGRPPPRAWRLVGWNWFIGAGPVLVATGGLVWVGVAWGLGAALMGLALLILMLFAAAPVWGAGLMRGHEERAARTKALAQWTAFYY